MSDHQNDTPKTPEEISIERANQFLYPKAPLAPKEWLKGEIIRTEVQRKAEEEAANLARLKAEAEAGKSSSGPRSEDKDVEARQRFVEDCAAAGQKGSGILFNELNRGRLIFVPEWNTWLEWRGQFWSRIWPFEAASRVENVAQAYVEGAERLRTLAASARAEEDAARAQALETRSQKLRSAVDKLHQKQGISACLDLSLSHESRLSVPGVKTDADNFIIVAKNGVVDLRSGMLRPGKPEDYFTRHCSVDWQGIDASCPKWEKMLFEILGEDQDVLHYMHKLLGMALCGDISEKIFVILLGAEGDSGKTTIFEILYEILTGSDGTSETGYVAPMPVELLLDQGTPQNPNSPTPAVLEMKGQRIAWASEPGENRRFSVDKIKLMSGDDSLVGRSPYDKGNTKFRPTHTLFLLTNHKMRAGDNDSAFWKRLKLVDCPYSFVSDPDPNNPMERLVNKNLKREILTEEAPGVLAWLVRGYQLYEIEGLTPPDKIRKDTEAYRREESIILQFADACLEEDPDAPRMAGAHLYSVFKAWFEDKMSRKGCPSITTFGKLAKRTIRCERSGGRVWYYGYRFNDQAEHDYPKEVQEHV